MPTASLTELERDDRATVAAFATIGGIVIAMLYYVGRIGFDNPALPIVITLGMCLFVNTLPFVVWSILPRGHYEEAESWWRSQPMLTIYALIITALGGMLVPLTGINVALLIAAIGFLAGVFAIALWVRRGNVGNTLFFVVLTGVFALWAAGVAWSTRYKTPVFWELLEYRANVHHDPLYYVSMANNMRTYGVPSTGLDGVPYTPYHYGSAWLNSQWAYLAQTDVLGFYSLGPSVIVIPLFFAAVLLLAVEVKKGWTTGRDVPFPPLRSDYISWAVFLAVTVGIIPSSGLDALGIWNRHALISESYVIGLPVFLLIIAVTIVYWRRRKTSHRASDVVFLFLFAPAALVVAGFLKVSTMILLLGAGLVLGLFGRLFRDRVYAFCAFVCLLVSFVTYKLVSVAAQNQGIVPFAYMRAQINPSWWPYFLFAHLFWSWVYIFLRLREERVSTVGEVRHAALEGRITDVVVLLVVALAGWVVGEVVDVHGGSAIYFSDVQRWLVLSLLMASAGRWLAQRRERGTWLVPTSWRGLRVSHVLLIVLLLPISITMVLNLMRAPATAARANVALRRAFYKRANVPPHGIRSLANHAILSKGLESSPQYGLVSTLRRFDAMNPRIKQQTAVFVPQSDSTFWHLWTEPERCSYVPFIVPAVSGLALIDGMAPVDCKLTVQYGMMKYQRRAIPQSPADTNQYAVCARAHMKGFSRVIMLSHTDSTHVGYHVVACPVRVAAPATG